MFKSHKTISIFMLTLLMLAFNMNNTVLAAKKDTVVLFYAKWNVASRHAMQVTKEVVDSYDNQPQYKELDVDLPSTPEISRSMNVRVPNVVPFIVLIDKKGDIIYSQRYRGQSKNDIKTIFDPLILKESK